MISEGKAMLWCLVMLIIGVITGLDSNFNSSAEFFNSIFGG